jgi:SnoaL-like domain
MTEVSYLVDNYIAAWNSRDPELRRALVGRTFSENAVYVDPLMTGEGIDGIDAMIGAAQEQFPGHRFSLADSPDAHHDCVRFSWHLEGEDGAVVARGLDVALLDAGRMSVVSGFLEAA